MVVTWTRVTNPPPAGNITLADDTEVDGSEGVVSHAGGYINTTTASTATAYYFRVLEDSDFTQSGGHLNIVGNSALITEAGSSILFTGSDNTYRLMFYDYLTPASNRLYGKWVSYGTNAKKVTIGGADGANRMYNLYAGYCNGIIAYYTVFQHITYGLYYQRSSMVGYFYRCEFTMGGGYCFDHAELAGVYYIECIIGDASTTYAFARVEKTVIFLIDCDIRQTNVSYLCFSTYYSTTFVYNTINWLDATPAVLVRTGTYMPGICEIECKTLTVQESNSLSGCDVSVVHSKIDDILDISKYTAIDKLNTWLLPGFMMMYEMLRKGNRTDATGASKIFVPSSVVVMRDTDNLRSTIDISKNTGGTFDGGYYVSISKDGYRSQSDLLFISGDQTWNVTLQPQADFDDIMDILGTPADFGSGDTIADNLKDLADDNGGADYDPATDSLEVISDKLTDVEALIDNMVVFGQITGPQHPVLDGSSSYYITMTDLTGAQIPSGAVTTAGSYMVMRWNSGTSTWDMIETDSLWAGDGVLTIDPVFSSVDWADGDIYMIMTDGLTIVTLDGDTFQKPGMVFYGMVGGDSTLTSINTKIGTPVSLDGGAATISGMLTKMADDNGGADYDATTDSLTSLSDTAQDILMDIGTGLDLGLKKPRPGARKG